MERNLKSPLAVILLTGLIGLASGYSAGAPPSVCESMIPGHHSPPQTSESPYKLTLSRNRVQSGESLEITLTSKNGTETFKGFMIQVRKPGSTKPIGEFTPDTNSRLVHCPGAGPTSAITHSNGDEKTSIKTRWNAPNLEENEEVQVLYTTVAPDASVYWTAVVHPEKIMIGKDKSRSDDSSLGSNSSSSASDSLQKWRELYAGCGKTKGCFGIPSKCVEAFNPEATSPSLCNILVTWGKDGDKNKFELAGKPTKLPGYVAVGFSNDEKMGDDSVVGCVAGGGSWVKDHVSRFHNPAYYNVRHGDDNLAIENSSIQLLDGVIFCAFEQTSHNISDSSVIVDFDTDRFHLLLSRGGFPGSKCNNLPPHPGPDDKGVSPQSIQMKDILAL